MIPIPSNVRVWIATGHTDMRRGMQGLALQVQEQLKRDPHCRRSLYLQKVAEETWRRFFGTTGSGYRFICEAPGPRKVRLALGEGGAVRISAAQMAYMLEKIDWRNPQLTPFKSAG